MKSIRLGKNFQEKNSDEDDDLDITINHIPLPTKPVAYVNTSRLSRVFVILWIFFFVSMIFLYFHRRSWISQMSVSPILNTRRKESLNNYLIKESIITESSYLNFDKIYMLIKICSIHALWNLHLLFMYWSDELN